MNNTTRNIYKVLLVLATATLSQASCNSENGAKSSATSNVDSQAVALKPEYDNSLQKGSVIDTIACQNYHTCTYALYLPSYYSVAKPLPCIYFFDAHARGSMPVRTYKDIAEKYGFILVGSNVSKNGMGWPSINDGVKNLFDDTRSRINIDPKRIYTSGFSGGSRVAGSIAIYDGGVAGVIGCAAGFPAVKEMIKNKFDYFGIVGEYDFNYAEMLQLDGTLQEQGFAHQLLTYTGIHGWPPAADFRTAILWMQLNGMKENLYPKNDSVIAQFVIDFDKRIATAKASSDLIELYGLLDGVSRTLDGMADVSAYKKQLNDLSANGNFKREASLQADLQKTEANQQQELANQFTEQGLDWWTKKIAELNLRANDKKKLQASKMNRRLLSLVSLLGYLNTNRALTQNDLTNAERFLKIFKMADPKNPDCAYLFAIYYMKKNDGQQALVALEQAAKMGYNEASTLMTEPSFMSLKNDLGFNKVVNRVIENSKSAN
jgi:hypothetical protein